MIDRAIVAASLAALFAALPGTGFATFADDPWEQAAHRATEAVDAGRKAGDPLRLAEALARRAEAFQALGHRPQALVDLEEAAALVDRPDVPPALVAGVTGALGQAYFLAGRLDRAEPTLGRALALARTANAPRLEAAVQNDLGLVLVAEAKPDAALAAYRAAAERARAANDGLLVAKASLNAARLAQRQRHKTEPAPLAREALAALATVADSRDKAFQLAAAGEVLRRAGDQAGAESALEQAARIAAELRDARATAYAQGYLAELALDRGRLADALDLNARAVFAAQSAGTPETLFLWQWQEARLLDRAGRPDDALAAYRRALEALAPLKVDYATELWASRESFRAEIGPAYLGYTDLLLRRAGGTKDAAELRKTLREAQGVLERFKTVELEDYFRDDCVARYLARAKPVEQTAPRTAVVYPVPLADRLDLLVSIGNDIHRVTVPVDEATLRKESLALRALLEKRTTYQYLPHAQRIYDWVIRPIEPMLEKAAVETLVFVPDQPLRSIPLAALHDGRGFLVQRYAIATAPSLTLTEPQPLAVKGARVLASGLTEAVQGFPALPYVGMELDELNAIGSGEVLRDRSFTAENLERELRDKPFSIVHVASHAQFESDSRRSFLLTYDGRMTIDRLEASMKLNRYRDEPVELLFLSACQTAAGDERAALGLAGVAVKAGVRSALATLWHINDQASSLLVAEFYRQVGQPGVSKAEALRRAQTKMLADLRYRHPGYWSPFLVIGNWL